MAARSRPPISLAKGDYDSWAWQFSASVPRIADAEAVDGDEVAIINGHESRHLVDGWSDNLSWGQQRNDYWSQPEVPSSHPR